MKKAVLYVFSGTGNTTLVAELYKKYLTDYETTICKIKCSKEDGYEPYPDARDFDLVGLAYPVHGFNAPKVMNDFTKLLPEIDVQNWGKKKTFIFKTSGEGLTFNNYSSQKIIRRMERKGYEFFTEHHFVMPYNMIFRHSPEMVKSEYIYADARVRLNVKELSENRKNKIHYCPLRYWFVPIVRIEWIYAQLQGPAMKVNMKKCIKCMKCVNICPMHNIKFDSQKEKFKFGTHCALCVGCSFNCPQKAISIGLLNGWRINGSYNIKKTATDENIEFPHFTNKLKGLHRWLYRKHYLRLEALLKENNIELIPQN